MIRDEIEEKTKKKDKKIYNQDNDDQIT